METFYPKGYIDSKAAHEMFNRIGHEGEANQDHAGLSCRPWEQQTTASPNADEDAEQVCPSFMSGGAINWDSRSAKQFGGFSQN